MKIEIDRISMIRCTYRDCHSEAHSDNIMKLISSALILKLCDENLVERQQLCTGLFEKWFYGFYGRLQRKKGLFKIELVVYQLAGMVRHSCLRIWSAWRIMLNNRDVPIWPFRVCRAGNI